ncbi:MAG: hypothetical protein ACPGVP_17970 [Thiolinea sp.]
MRGGSWNNNQENARAARRNRNLPTNRNNNVGFRLCCAFSPTSLFTLYGCLSGFKTTNVSCTPR